MFTAGLLMGGTFDNVGFGSLVCCEYLGSVRGFGRKCRGCVGWGFTGAHYWVLKAQTLGFRVFGSRFRGRDGRGVG